MAFQEDTFQINAFQIEEEEGNGNGDGGFGAIFVAG